MIAKRTPWKFEENPSAFHFGQVVDALNDAVCTPHGAHSKDIGLLTAAAPDMLASLVELVEAIDFEIEQRKQGGNAEDWADLQERSNRAHAAIAKAGGLL